MKKYYKLALLNFSIEGSNSIVDSLFDEFSSIEIKDKCNTSIDFIFTTDIQPLEKFVQVENILIGQNKFQINNRALQYQVYIDEQKKLKVLLRYKEKIYNRSILRNKIYQFKNFNYLTPVETHAKNFMYNIFDYLSAVKLVEHDACYLHASTLKNNDKCIALMAWGGVGKTSAMLKLVLEDEWKYLSDDLGLIDKNGYLWRTPKHMQIYAYNIMGQPLLEKNLMADRSPLDKLSWHIRLLKNGPKGVRRRVSAEELLGEKNVEFNGKLTDLFYLERSDTPCFEISTVSIDNIIERSNSILLNELQPFTDYSLAMHSTSIRPIIPKISTFVEECSSILYKALQSVTPKLIKIPLNAGPDDLANFIRSQLNSTL